MQFSKLKSSCEKCSYNLLLVFVPTSHFLLSLQKDLMASTRPTVELKDIPPPPPPPPLQPRTTIFPLSKIQPPPIKSIHLPAGPKVSCCALCSNATSCTSDMRFNGSGFIQPKPILDKNVAGTITCQVAPGVPLPPESCFKGVATSGPCNSRAPVYSNVCMEKRLSPCHLYPPHSVPCCTNVRLNQFHGDLHKFQLPAFGTSPGYYPYSDFTNGPTLRLKEHLAQSEMLPHFCTSSLHLNTAPPVFLKGSSFCEVCLEKVSMH